jgi:flagellar biosynthesis/type III secretory pathway protein FliH
MDSLRTSMVKQVFSREQFTHKKGLLFTPSVHTDEGSLETPQPPASDDGSPATVPAAQASPNALDTPAESVAEAPNLEMLRVQAFTQGMAHGLAQAQQHAMLSQTANEQQLLAAQAAAHTQALLQAIDHKVNSLIEDPALLQEPLKRLALHLAEQLVLAELSLSPQAVEQLIERCMDTLDATEPSAMVVELNPQDLALLQNQQRAAGQPKPAWRLQADHVLLPGSVRVRADDAVVSDLIENRLESLAHSLLSDPQAWQAQTAFAPSKLANRLATQRGSAHTVEDAQAKPRAMPAGAAASAPLQEARPAEEQAAIEEHSSAAEAETAHADTDAEFGDVDAHEKHTYEAHDVMQAAPAPPEAVTKNFAEALSDISLELGKLDD